MYTALRGHVQTRSLLVARMKQAVLLIRRLALAI